jgi:hypothetical protein
MPRYLPAALGVTATALIASTAFAQNRGVVTCSGVLIEVDMEPYYNRLPPPNNNCKRCGYFPMTVVYDNDDPSGTRTCVLDVGFAGHWPLRGSCWPGERCTLTGPYFKRIGDTYYMRLWDNVSASAPDHNFEVLGGD